MMKMMAWPNHTRFPVKCLKTYLAKRNPMCSSLWQKPKDHRAAKLDHTAPWYCNQPIKRNKLKNHLTEMCRKAGLSTIYTPQCIRATSITLLKSAGLENSRVRSVTGHANAKSIEAYSSRPTIKQHDAILLHREQVHNPASFLQRKGD